MSKSAMSKSAVITGAASGIGRATAVRLAREGYRLALLDMNPDRLEETAQACREAGAEALPLACDVRDDAGVARIFGQVEEAFGAPDLMVLSAGVGRYAPFLDISVEEWATMLDVNIMGVVRCLRAALPGMVARGRGRIVLLGSRRGLEPTGQTNAYSTTKAGLHGLAGSLAEELAPAGLHVCLLCPGGIRTDFRFSGGQKDPRFMEAEDIAETIAFMASTPDRAWVRRLDILPPGL